MKLADLEVRLLTTADLVWIAGFSCSRGEPWQDQVEQQVRGPLPRRYLSVPPRFDGRMLLGFGRGGDLLVVGAHHIEPTFEPDVGYTEVIAVALAAQGSRVELPDGELISLGHFMLLTIFKQMRALGRHPRTFVRVDRRNGPSLSLCDRAGLTDERPDPHSDLLVQRWGELPQ